MDDVMGTRHRTKTKKKKPQHRKIQKMKQQTHVLAMDMQFLDSNKIYSVLLIVKSCKSLVGQRERKKSKTEQGNI